MFPISQDYVIRVWDAVAGAGRVTGDEARHEILFVEETEVRQQQDRQSQRARRASKTAQEREVRQQRDPQSRRARRASKIAQERASYREARQQRDRERQASETAQIRRESYDNSRVRRIVEP